MNANEIQAACPWCGRNMTLTIGEDCDQGDARRLAQMTVCDRCADSRRMAREEPDDTSGPTDDMNSK